MLSPGAHARLVPIAPPVFFSQLSVARASALGKVSGRRRNRADDLTLPHIGRVAIDAGFLAMQKLGQDLTVVHIGRCGNHRVDQLGPAVNAHMGLHAEVPLIPFASLAHLRITLAFTILCRAGCADDGGIHNRAAMNLDTVLTQILLDQLEQLLTQIVGLKQMPELADRGLVRNPLLARSEERRVGKEERNECRADEYTKKKIKYK